MSKPVPCQLTVAQAEALSSILDLLRRPNEDEEGDYIALSDESWEVVNDFKRAFGREAPPPCPPMTLEEAVSIINRKGGRYRIVNVCGNDVVSDGDIMIGARKAIEKAQELHSQEASR